MKKVWIVPAVAVAAGMGFLAQRWIEGPAAGAPAASATAAADAAQSDADASDQAAALAAATPPPLVIPETLPQFSLADREGKMRTLGDWAGRPLLVNYWATWCAPCRREIPLLNELRAEGRAPNLEVIGIAVDFRDDVLHYASETTIDYPLLIGEEDGLKAVQAMGMQPAFPFTVFADSKQRIVTLKVGELHRDEAELILEKVRAIDAGTLPISQAKTEIEAAMKELATQRAAREAAQASVARRAGAVAG